MLLHNQLVKLLKRLLPTLKIDLPLLLKMGSVQNQVPSLSAPNRNLDFIFPSRMTRLLCQRKSRMAAANGDRASSHKKRKVTTTRIILIPSSSKPPTNPNSISLTTRLLQPEAGNLTKLLMITRRKQLPGKSPRFGILLKPDEVLLC